MERSILEIDDFILIILERMKKIIDSIFDGEKINQEVSLKKIENFFKLLDIMFYIKDMSLFLKKEYSEPDGVIHTIDNIFLNYPEKFDEKLNENIFKNILEFYKRKSSIEELSSINYNEETRYAIRVLYTFKEKGFLKRKMDLLKDEKLKENQDLTKRLEPIEGKVKDEKKQFCENIFDLEKRLSHFKGYDVHLKQSSIKEFLLEVINIKETANDGNFYLYLVNRRRRAEKNFHRIMYKDIKHKKEGIDTSILCNQITSNILAKNYPLEELSKENKNFYDECSLISNLIKDRNICEIKKIFLKDVKEFKSGYEEIFYKKESMTKETFPYNWKEKLKNKGYLLLEMFSIMEPQNIKYLLDVIKESKKDILEFNLKNRSRLEENQNKISLRDYNNEYINREDLKELLAELKKRTKSEIKSSKEKRNKAKYRAYLAIKKLIKQVEKTNKISNINKIELEKISDENLPQILKMLIRFFQIKEDSKFTIKDELARYTITYLRVNDYIAELKMYLRILEEINKKSCQELNDELKKYKKIQEKNFPEERIQEKRSNELIRSIGNDYIKGKYYSKSIKMKPLDLKQEEGQYIKEYNYYKSILYIKYIQMKLYFNDASVFPCSKKYFEEFCNLIQIYIELLESTLDTLGIYDKINIDMHILQIIEKTNLKIIIYYILYYKLYI